MSVNHCGECKLCCRLLGIAELPDKKIGEWCNFNCSAGCSIYENRPQSCIEYQCLWLQSQKPDSNHTHGTMSIDYRPDKCGVIFETTQDLEVVAVRAHSTQRYRLDKPQIQQLLSRFRKNGVTTFEICGDKRRIVLADNHPSNQRGNQVIMSILHSDGIRENLELTVGEWISNSLK